MKEKRDLNCVIPIITKSGKEMSVLIQKNDVLLTFPMEEFNE